MATAIENNVIEIDLLTACNTTGWSIAGDIASHTSCNAGSITLLGYDLVVGQTYQISYVVPSISGGYVQAVAGTTGGTHRTTAGLYVETIVANGTTFSFFSNATCTLQVFNIQKVINTISNFQQQTPVFSVNNHKYGEFRTIAPDFGFSLDVDMLTVYQGKLYLHQNGSDDRNVFYGVAYQSIVQYVDNAVPAAVKTYQSLSIQSNQLMVTGDNGISTSLGQVSELSEIDFVKDVLSDANSSVAVETIEGVFSANFLRDINTGLLDGDVLRGNYMVIQLISTSNTPLRLYTVNIVSQHSAIGSR